MPWRLPYLSTALLAWAIACGIAAAQVEQPAEESTLSQPPAGTEPKPAQPEAEPGPPPAGPPAIEAAPLDTFYLRDSKGNLVPVLGITFEEFEQLLKLKRGLAPAGPPPFSLDSLAVTGQAEERLAKLEVTASIRLRESGWVRVPLKLNKGALTKTPAYEGPGEQFIVYDGQDGYVAWLQGSGEKPHVVKLSLSLPINSLGAESRIETTLPRATESTLKLSVPQAKVDAQLKTGNEGLVSTGQSSGKSEIRVLGGGGELSLSWRSVQASAAAKVQLEASGEITVKVEGANRVTSEARLMVRSLGDPLETFRVRLPASMELVPANPTGYTVAAVESADATPTDGGRSVVEIKLDRPSVSAAEVRLLASLKPAAAQPTATCQPAGFEVLDAVQQRGTIDFLVDGDWSLSWTEDGSTRRVEPPAAADGTRKSQARFEYYRQPCGLQVKIEPQPTRVAVEPTYVVYVEPKALRLEATFKYRVRGARAQALAVALGDWQFASVEPDTIVEVESLNPSGPQLMLPLRSGAAAGTFEVRLSAHKMLAEDTSDVTFTLPRPAGDLVAAASVFIVPADNVELVPKARELVGLIPSPQTPPARLPQRQQPPLAYRDLGVGGEAKFVGQAQLRTRQTTVGAAARVQFGDQATTVEQRLAYRILYEPQRTFTLQVPTSLLARGELKVLLGTEVLPPIPLGDGESSRISRVQVIAPTDQIGAMELLVQYSLPAPRLSPGQAVMTAVPLVIPEAAADQSSLGQSLVASWSESLQVELAPGRAGEVAPALETASSSELRATSGAMIPDVRFQLQTSDPQRGNALEVSRVWVQTLLTENARIERAAWRLTASNGPLRIRLPRDARIDEAKLAVDGQALEFTTDSGALVASVPGIRGEAVLEAWYTVPITTAPAAGAIRRLDPPMIERAGQSRQSFWQVCLPGTRHMLADPAGFTPEHAWSWRGYFWELQGTMDQEQLEAWVGAQPQNPIPGQWNHYLYSTFSSPASLEVVSLPRTAILWSMGAVVLALGLALLHVPRLRHPSVLLVLVVVVVAAGLSWPSSALLLAQGGIAAVVVLAAALFWQWTATGRTAYPPPQVRPITEQKSTMPPTVRPESPLPTTAAAAPLAGLPEAQP